jgi:hypothetical protein
MAVDLILFPLDTVKTRLQSAAGFTRSGGLSNIYSGIASTLIGSAPSGKPTAYGVCSPSMVTSV